MRTYGRTRQQKKNMRLKVRYFGMITEWAGTDYEDVEIVGNKVEELRSALVRSIPQLATITFQIAVNQSIVSSEIALNENDEVAILPPFAGG